MFAAKMKTSAAQFEMLVDFMEKHGDLNRPDKHFRSRIQVINNWEKLTNDLNSGHTGDKKGTEKWKKVWSDLKNNTKKKVARINKAALSSDGGLTLRLNDLEERVLNIIGLYATPGSIGVVDAGYIQKSPLSSAPQVQVPRPYVFTEVVKEETPVIDTDLRDASIASPPVSSSPILSLPSQETPEEVEANPSQRRQMPRRRRIPRRRFRLQSHEDQGAVHFLRSDKQWRAFIVQKHKNECRLERDRLQLREKELQIQEKWQEVAMHAVDALHKIIDLKFFKD